MIALDCAQCSAVFHALPARARKHHMHFCADTCRRLYYADFPNRFWEKVRIGAFRECWPWQGCTQSQGYGQIRSGGKCYVAHRVAFNFMWHQLPDNVLALHRCDNPPCCNPWHLFDGSHHTNHLDMMVKGRWYGGERLGGEAHAWAKITNVDVIVLKKLYENGEASIRQLAITYGVTYQAIWYIVKGRNRKHA